MVDIDFDKLLGSCRDLFPDKKHSERKCPECEKRDQFEGGPKWEPWMGSLKDHLAEHYRVRHFKEKIKEDDKYRTSARHRPWATDYAPVVLEKLERHLDKAIFENYFLMKKEAEEKARMKKEKERRKLLVDRENEKRRREFEERLHENKHIFSESDSDSEAERRKKKRKRSAFSDSDDDDVRARKKSKEASRKKSEDAVSRVMNSENEFRNAIKRKSLPNANRPGAENYGPKTKRARAGPLPKMELQKHELPFAEFVAQLGEVEHRFCPLCDREVSPGDDELFDMDGFRALAPAERAKLQTEFIEAHVTMCGRLGGYA